MNTAPSPGLSWSNPGDVLKSIAHARATQLEERLGRGEDVNPAEWLTIISVCRSWRSELFACPQLWLRIPADIGAGFLRFFLPHASPDLSVRFAKHLSTSPYIDIDIPAPLHSALRPDLLITQMSINGLGTVDIVALVSYFAEHLQNLVIETSSRTDRFLYYKRNYDTDIAQLIPLPWLETLSIITDCKLSFTALTKMTRLAHHAEKRVCLSQVLSPNNVQYNLRTLLCDQVSEPCTLYVDAEAHDYIRVMLYPGIDSDLSPTGVPQTREDPGRIFLDVWLKWDPEVIPRDRRILSSLAFTTVSECVPTIQNVTLSFGHTEVRESKGSIDLSVALNCLAHTAPLHTLTLRGDYKRAVTALMGACVPVTTSLVVEDSKHIRNPSTLREAVAIFNPVVNELQSFGYKPTTFIGGCGLFSDRCKWSTVIWDILIPEELLDDWEGSWIIDLEPLPDCLVVMVNDVLDEWYEEHHNHGLGGQKSRSYEEVEHALIEVIMRFKKTWKITV